MTMSARFRCYQAKRDGRVSLTGSRPPASAHFRSLMVSAGPGGSASVEFGTGSAFAAREAHRCRLRLHSRPRPRPLAALVRDPARLPRLNRGRLLPPTAHGDLRDEDRGRPTLRLGRYCSRGAAPKGSRPACDCRSPGATTRLPPGRAVPARSRCGAPGRRQARRTAGSLP